MEITPENELLFLQDGLKSGVLQDLVIAQAHIDRMRDLLDIGARAIAVELGTNSAAHPQRAELARLQHSLVKQKAVLSPILASVQTAESMFFGELEVEGADIYERMVEVIASHPELLEDRATANAVALGDNDASTQGKRFELNRLFRSNDK